MIPTNFKQANIVYGPPEDLAESQCMKIAAFRGIVNGGSVDGCLIVVTAWTPTEEELKKLQQGDPIFISFIGGLPPHFPCVNFEEAINPA